MKIKLKQLIIKNFKGIKSLVIDFNDITNIEGANRAGKTTIFDAMNYLLFGKNAEDKKDFAIKPTTPEGEIIPKLENEVFGLFDIDGREMKFKRTQREKWVKKHGESETILTGHETVYEINDAPIKQKDYQFKIDSLVNENLFKLVTNPLYFNSLHWEKRREMLIGLTEQKSDIDILNGMKKPSAELLKMLNEGKTIEEIKKELSGKIKRLKDELKLIPVRIDEVSTSKPEAKEWAALEKELKKKVSELQNIENSIHDKSKALTDFNNSRIEEQKEVYYLRDNLTDFISKYERDEKTDQNAIDSKIHAKQNGLERSNYDLNNVIENIKDIKENIEKYNIIKAEKLDYYHKLDKTKFIFDENKTVCEVCDQLLPTDQLNDKKESLENKFNLNKEDKLNIIVKDGHYYRDLIETRESDLKEFEQIKINFDKIIVITEKEIKELENEKELISVVGYEETPIYKQLNKAYQTAKTKFQAVEAPKVDKTALLNDKAFKMSEIEQINVQLRVKDQIETAEKRIKELEAEEKTKAGLLVALEKTEFAIDNFIKHKMSSIETEVNKMFTLVKFRMFESQLNGGEKEACICLFNGVPYSDANSEAKINGGLDIINIFSKHYNIFAPIFIDNREGVTNLIEVKTQLINLFVNPKYKTLNIS